MRPFAVRSPPAEATVLRSLARFCVTIQPDVRIAEAYVNPPAYRNFSTTLNSSRALPLRRGSTRRRSQVTTSLPSNESVENGETQTEESRDPYAHVKIFRRDMADSSSSSSSRGGGSNVPLSVDVPMKKFIDMFCDFESKRCKLCNESILHWSSHQGAIPHGGREGILIELVRAYCGTPEEIMDMWWYRLDNSPDLPRLPHLSHKDPFLRKRRLQYLLHFLKDREVLRDTFNITQTDNTSAGRTWEFERLEFLGDQVVKYFLNNRINVIFPVKEGGIRGKLTSFQFVMDGNDGLARGYDYLELQHLTQSQRVVSKFKSDVVETLFGELQMYLWATEVEESVTECAFPFTAEVTSLRTVVRHVMEELANVIFMYHAESIMGVLQRVLRENQVRLVRANPRENPISQGSAFQPRHAVSGAGEEGWENWCEESGHPRELRSTATAPTSTLSNSPVPRSAVGSSSATHHSRGESVSSTALYMESTNYSNFKRVVSVGGLLPRAFPQEELAVVPHFMPHLSQDPTLTPLVKTRRKDLLSEVQVDTSSQTQKPDVPTFKLHSHPKENSVVSVSPSLRLAELKDAQLIDELL